MSALNPLRLKGEAFGANLPAAGDYTSNSAHVMQSPPSTTTTIITSPPPQYRFPDVPPPAFPSPSSASSPSASSPSDSPSIASPSSSSSSSANSSSISLRPIIFAPQPVPASGPASPLLSLSDFYLPTLTPDEILDTLDHLASMAPKKKSHARKQPAGHIPRPRNAFILFRCLFVSQQAVPASVEKDHRNISRIAGKVWKSMSNEQRDPWVKASELEKTRHEARFPNYRYNPVQPQLIPKRFTQLKSPDLHKPKHEDHDDHAFLRLASVPPSVQEEDGAKISHVASFVSEGKHGPLLEPAIHPFYADPPQFIIPWAHTYSDLSLPPDSPPPPTPAQYSRLATRRSSSCPPLPPLAAAFPFNNPNPWLAPSYTSQASSPSPSPFAYSFPPPPPPAPLPGPLPAAPVPADRPLTAPEHDFFFSFPPPAASARFDSRLAHRRGSSLDRAIASSSIAGAFGGGGLPRHCWTPDASMSFSRRPSQVHQVPMPQHSGEATPTEFASSSDGAGTPPPALSPQSSFELDRERGRSPLPRALRHENADDIMVPSSPPSPSPHSSPLFHTPHTHFPTRRRSRSRSPPPPTKIPARLFGSQGARLGLDLDLDLDLDVSFGHHHHPAPPTSPRTTGGEGEAVSSYTQASLLLMDTD